MKKLGELSQLPSSEFIIGLLHSLLNFFISLNPFEKLVFTE